eukprot:10959919-Lingulodinium_polyedra.AAC.1
MLARWLPRLTAGLASKVVGFLAGLPSTMAPTMHWSILCISAPVHQTRDFGKPPDAGSPSIRLLEGR